MACQQLSSLLLTGSLTAEAFHERLCRKPLEITTISRLLFSKLMEPRLSLRHESSRFEVETATFRLG